MITIYVRCVNSCAIDLSYFFCFGMLCIYMTLDRTKILLFYEITAQCIWLIFDVYCVNFNSY